MECPRCNTLNSAQAERCKTCGYSFTEEKTSELARTTQAVQNYPDDALVWKQHAWALYGDRQIQEAEDALDRSMSLLKPGFNWASYDDAARLYSLLGDPSHACRLWADGILYHLENYGDDLDSTDLEDASQLLRLLANQKATVEFNAKDPGERMAERMVHERVHGVSFDEDPRPDLEGLGTYEMARTLASEPSRRLIPGSRELSLEIRAPKRARERSPWTNRRILNLALVIVFAIIALWAVTCCANQCGF